MDGRGTNGMMRVAIGAVMACMAATGVRAQAPPAGQPVVEPSGKWVVDYGETGCLLMRSYGTGKDQVYIGWRALPLADRMQLVMQRRGGDVGLRRGALEVTVTPGGMDQVRYESFPGSAAGQRRLNAWVQASQFAKLPDRAVLTLAPSGQKPVAVALVKAERGFTALATCNDATLRQWGIDPAERERIATPASGGEASQWIGAVDYPMDAVSRGAIGSTTMLWAVDVSGRARDCRTVISSGTEALDKAGCAALTRRARFTPATGRDGAPMVSHMSTNIVWMMQGAWDDDPALRKLEARDRERERQKEKAAD